MELLIQNNELRSHEVIRDDENLLSVYYDEIQLMHLVWKRRTVGEPYRNAFSEGLDYSRTNPTKFFLSDIRNQGVVGPEDRKWVESVALKGIKERGVSKIGIISESSAFKMYYINLLLKAYVSKGINMKYFKELNIAENWLLDN